MPSGTSARTLSVRDGLKGNTPTGKSSDKAANALLPVSNVTETVQGDAIKVEPEKQPKVRARVVVASKQYKTGILRVIQFNLASHTEWRVSFKQKDKSTVKVENKHLTAEKLTSGSEKVSHYGTYRTLEAAIHRFHEMQHIILYTPNFLYRGGVKKKPLVLTKRNHAATIPGELSQSRPQSINTTELVKPVPKKIKYSAR